MASEKEKKIKDLAKTLLKSGFAMSESEALSKAGEIVETEEKVTVRKDQSDKKEGGLFSKIKHAFHRHKAEVPEPPEDMPPLAAETAEEVDFSGDERPLNEIMQGAGVETDKSSSAETQPSAVENPFDHPVEQQDSPAGEGDPPESKAALVEEAEHQRALAEKAEALEKELEAVKAKLREMKKYPKKEEISEIKTEIREMSQEMDELEYEEKKSEEG